MDCGRLKGSRAALAIGVLALAFRRLGLRRQAADGFPRPGRGLARRLRSRSFPRSPCRRQGAGASIVRFYLYWSNVSPERSRIDRNPNDYDYQWSSGLQANNTQAPRTVSRSCLRPHGAGVGGARGAEPPRGDPRPRSRLLQEGRESRCDPLQGRMSRSGASGTSRTQALPRALSTRKGSSSRRTMYRKLLKAAASSIHGGPVTTRSSPARPPRSRTGTAGASRRRPAHCLPSEAPLRGLSSGKPTSSTNVRADNFTTHPYTSGNAFRHAFSAERRLLRRRARVEARSFLGRPRRGTSRTAAAATTSATGSTNSAGTRSRSTRRRCPSTSTRAGRPRPSTAPGSSASAPSSGSAPRLPARTDKCFGQYQSGLYYCDDDADAKDCTPNCKDPKDGGQLDCQARAAARSDSPSSPTPRTGASRSGGGRRIAIPVPVVIQRRTSSGAGSTSRTHPRTGNGIFAKSISSGLQGRRSTGDRRERRVAALFSLVRPKERFVNPFGCGGGIPC